jgi:hypothetical protein
LFGLSIPSIESVRSQVASKVVLGLAVLRFNTVAVLQGFFLQSTAFAWMTMMVVFRFLLIGQVLLSVLCRLYAPWDVWLVDRLSVFAGAVLLVIDQLTPIWQVFFGLLV